MSDTEKKNAYQNIELSLIDFQNCTLDELTLLDVISKNPYITQKGIAMQIGKSERTVKTRTIELQKKGYLVRINGKRNGFWEIRSEQNNQQ